MAVLACLTSAAAATVDVTTHGATGNDTTNDDAAIASAIAAANVGDTVYFPNGTYYINAAIVPKTGIKLTGESQNGAILKFNGTTESTSMIRIKDISNVEVSYLTLDGSNSANANRGILCNNGSGHYFHHLTIKDFGTPPSGVGPLGIYLTGVAADNTLAVTDTMIADNTFTNMGIDSLWGGAVRITDGCARIQVLGNTISNTGRGGIFAKQSTELVIRGNVVTGSGRTASGLSIELSQSCDNSIVEDNLLDHWLSIDGSKNIAIRRNRVEDMTGVYKSYGLEVVSGKDIVATDNHIDEGQKIGFSLNSRTTSYPTGFQFYGYNTVRFQTQWGAQIQGTSTVPISKLYFYRNTFEDTYKGHPYAMYPGADGHGFRMNINAKNIALHENNLINNDRHGIEITTNPGVDQFSVVNNTITGNGGASINQYPSAALDLEWTGNTVASNGTNTQLTSRGFSNAKPVANFTAPASAMVGTAVTFTNTSTDTGGSIAHSLWNFGDGAPVSADSANSPAHTFNKVGTYRVTLVVWDDLGRGALKESTIVITALPPPWLDQDIGAVGVAGTASYVGGTFTLEGSGTDIWGTGDQFRFAYQTMNGDGQIVARVASMENTSINAKAGVMIRETLNADSKHALMNVTPGLGAQFTRRTATAGSSTYTQGVSVTAPYWVKLERTGSTITAYTSPNGTTWTTVGSATISMASSVKVGLAVLSRNNATLNTSTFDNVSVVP